MGLRRVYKGYIIGIQLDSIGHPPVIKKGIEHPPSIGVFPLEPFAGDFPLARPKDT